MNKLRESKMKPSILHYKIFQSDDRDAMFRGFKHWDESKSDSYRCVCTVDWFAGFTSEGHDWYVEDKEEVFRILNGYYMDEDTGEDEVYDFHVHGFGVRSGTRKDGSYWECRDMRSLSVGDIIVDHSPDQNGKAYIVDSFGFKEVVFNYEITEDKFLSELEKPGKYRHASVQGTLDLEVA